MTTLEGEDGEQSESVCIGCVGTGENQYSGPDFRQLQSTLPHTRHPRWRQARAAGGHRSAGRGSSQTWGHQETGWTRRQGWEQAKRASLEPHEGTCPARLRGAYRARGPKALPAPSAETTERGGGAGITDRKVRRMRGASQRVVQPRIE